MERGSRKREVGSLFFRVPVSEFRVVFIRRGDAFVCAF